MGRPSGDTPTTGITHGCAVSAVLAIAPSFPEAATTITPRLAARSRALVNNRLSSARAKYTAALILMTLAPAAIQRCMPLLRSRAVTSDEQRRVHAVAEDRVNADIAPRTDCWRPRAPACRQNSCGERAVHARWMRRRDAASLMRVTDCFHPRGRKVGMPRDDGAVDDSDSHRRTTCGPGHKGLQVHQVKRAGVRARICDGGRGLPGRKTQRCLRPRHRRHQITRPPRCQRPTSDVTSIGSLSSAVRRKSGRCTDCLWVGGFLSGPSHRRLRFLAIVDSRRRIGEAIVRVGRAWSKGDASVAALLITGVLAGRQPRQPQRRYGARGRCGEASADAIAYLSWLVSSASGGFGSVVRPA